MVPLTFLCLSQRCVEKKDMANCEAVLNHAFRLLKQSKCYSLPAFGSSVLFSSIESRSHDDAFFLHAPCGLPWDNGAEARVHHQSSSFNNGESVHLLLVDDAPCFSPRRGTSRIQFESAICVCFLEGCRRNGRGSTHHVALAFLFKTRNRYEQSPKHNEEDKDKVPWLILNYNH